MSADVQEERGPGKRARRAPRRLVEESFAGVDLDKRLNKEFRRREAVAATATTLAAATTTKYAQCHNLFFSNGLYYFLCQIKDDLFYKRMTCKTP